MDKEQVIDILERHNRWRRGADIEMVSQTELGRAIDYAVEFMRGNIK